MKLGTVVAIDYLSKPVDFGFKRSSVTSTQARACVFSAVAEPTIKSLYHCEYLSTPTSWYVGVDLRLHRVHFSSSYYLSVVIKYGFRRPVDVSSLCPHNVSNVERTTHVFSASEVTTISR